MDRHRSKILKNEELEIKKKKLSCLKFVMFVWFVVNFFFYSEFLQAQEDEKTQEQIQAPIPSAGFLMPPPEKGDFWFSPGAEIALYSKYSFSYGAGFAFAYGRKVSVGLKAAFLFDNHQVLDVLELQVLLRLYIAGRNANSGPFFQIAGGTAIFFPNDGEISLPAEFGILSAGLSFGWRFLLGSSFFIEPSVRGGYPFIAGGSLSIGLRF